MAATRPALALTALLLAAASSPAAEARGTVARYDPETKELQLAERPLLRRPPLTFTLAADAVVMDGLAAGRRVRVEYEARDGRLVAKAVHLLGAAPAEKAAPAMGGDEVAGALRRVALTDREIVVVGPGARGAETETTFAVPEGARVLRSGQAVGLEGLREGEAVRVRVEKRDGRAVAVQVQAGAGGAAAPASDLIPKVRLGLRLLDMTLEQMEKK